MSKKLDAATLRALAVKFDCDPRSIVKASRGEPVRGMAGKRAEAAAAEALGNKAEPEQSDHDRV